MRQASESKRVKHRMPKSSANELFKGVPYCTGREGPELYVNKIDRLGLYASIQSKNGSDVKRSV